MIGVLRTKSDTRAIIEPESPSLGLFLWNLEAFFSPNSIDSIFAHIESIHIQKPCHFSVAVSSKELGKIDHSPSKFFIKWIDFVLISLCAAIETDDFAGPAFGNAELVYDMRNGFFFPGRA